MLAHEAGHIYCGHLAANSIIGNDVREEFEANEFAHYLLNRSGFEKLSSDLKKHRTAIILIDIFVLAISFGLAVFNFVRADNIYYGEYYVTSTGLKYHLKSCPFVEGKSSLRRLTSAEYEAGEYSPCQVCLQGE